MSAATSKSRSKAKPKAFTKPGTVAILSTGRTVRLYALALTGRDIDCPGEAHSNAYIDNCGTCAPRWGVIAEREPPLSVERVAELLREGYAVDVNHMGREAYDVYQERRAFVQVETRTRSHSTMFYAAVPS